MEFVLFLSLLALFLFGVGIAVRARRRGKEFMIVLLIVGVMIATLVLFTANYEKWDAGAIIVLLIVTAIAGIVMATRR